MLEMPEMFERHLSLGQKAYQEAQYESARGHFEEAYQLKDDIEANLWLTKSLMTLGLYQNAYDILMEKKTYYLTKEEGLDVYFEVILNLNFFLEIEKLLVTTNSDKRLEWESSYQTVKDYQLLMHPDKYKTLIESLTHLHELPPMKQGNALKNLVFLPKEMAVEIAEKLLIDQKVSLFMRSELVQELVALQITSAVKILTYDGSLKEFQPNEMEKLTLVYQKSALLKELSHYFSKRDPALEAEVLKAVKIHIGLLYPFHEIEMIPMNKWCERYIQIYQGEGDVPLEDDELIEVSKKQDKLDEAVFQLLFF